MTETKLLTRDELLALPWANECEVTLLTEEEAGGVIGMLVAMGLDVSKGEKLPAIGIAFSPIANWYAITAASCPIDGTRWTWQYGELPGFTTARSMAGRTNPRDVRGFTLIRSGHRSFAMKCGGTCGETYLLHNFD